MTRNSQNSRPAETDPYDDCFYRWMRGIEATKQSQGVEAKTKQSLTEICCFNSKCRLYSDVKKNDAIKQVCVLTISHIFSTLQHSATLHIA